MGIPTAVLNNFRRFVGTTLDKTGEVHRPTKVWSDEGGHSATWVPVATGIHFSVSEGFGGQSQLEQPILDRIGTRVPYFLTFGAAFDIDEDDRVYETAPEVRTFQVIGFPNREVSNQSAVRIVAVELG